MIPILDKTLSKEMISLISALIKLIHFLDNFSRTVFALDSDNKEHYFLSSLAVLRATPKSFAPKLQQDHIPVLREDLELFQR